MPRPEYAMHYEPLFTTLQPMDVAVPAGMLHRPLVPVRSAVLMIEKAGVIATGD
jgi:hypothetical protein